MFSLKRISDGAGDVGQLTIYRLNSKPELSYDILYNEFPVFGDIVEVGALSARSYSQQDYWRTTRITEIISKTNTTMIFRTNNSVYELTHT